MGGTRRHLPPLRALALATCLLAFATSVRGDAALPRLVLVFDASGSMWGEIDGRPKIEIARDVVHDLLADWDPRVELGLTVYGHRREGDCGDIERLVPLGPPAPARIRELVDGIRPRGKTPIARSIEMAAQELRYLDDPATLILVTDGHETCGVDPCAVARELEERGVAFTAHVIGFDLKPDEREQLQCLADATGGMFLAAADARSLRDALRAAVREATADVDTSDGVWLAAALATDRHPVAEPVHWQIARADDGIVVHRSTRPQVSLALAAGRYRVEARYQGVVGTASIEVKDGVPLGLVVPLDAGRLELAATERSLDEPLADGVSWEVRRVGVGEEPLARQTDEARVGFTLPAGRYRVTAYHAGARVSRELVLRAGEVRREHLRFGSGRLALRAVLRPGLMPVDQPIRWEVRTEPGGRVLLMEQKPTTLASLESGRYWVTATYGETRVGRWIDVHAGRTRTHTLDLAAGSVRVFGSLAPPGGPISDPIDWEVASEEGEVVARRTGPAHSFVLPAGHYVIAGRFAGARAEAEVAVRAGETGSVQLVFGAAPARSE